MNIVLGLIILFVCIGVGYVSAKRYTIRKEFYCDFYEFNKVLKNEISFSQKTIEDIISKNRKDSEFYKCINAYYTSEKIDYEEIRLDETEKEFFISYFNSIGKSDRETQIKFLDSVSDEIKHKFDLTRDEEKQYKSLYFKMSILCGLLLFVIVL